ncbi:MAG: S23 ribosomal protein [Microgenomates group bacterium Gr01-1014_7]|nr:MAG: S23 ribosomal protein [Microgenomates group bacterium Gr01-1014_7]
MSLEINSYKKLIFWQKSKEVSRQIIQLTRKLPSERIVWIITDQVLRSSFSVGACIAEGYGKYLGKEYPRFLQMALGSARETEYWLELLEETYSQFSDQIKKILLLNEETIKMLIATLKTLRKNRG